MQARADRAGIPSEAGEGVRLLVGFALEQNDELVKVTSEWGELDGQRTRIIRVKTVNRAPVDQTREKHDLDITTYLSPDRGRLLRSTMSYSDSGTTKRVTVDVYPIRYGVEPPASISTIIPEGIRVAMDGATYHGHMVDPVWEHMSEEERGEITQVVQATLGAWSRGDWSEFQQHYEFAGVMQYGVKGKFTPEEFREHWRFQVEQQRGRWKSAEVGVEYAVETGQPPRMALRYWSVEREGLPPGEGWIKYRDEPTAEPGLAVFARLSGTDAEGKAHEAGTVVFLKRIGGQYKVILWQPPF